MSEELQVSLKDDLFETVFHHMDVNNDGLVDQTEFTVGMCLLMNKGSARANISFHSIELVL